MKKKTQEQQQPQVTSKSVVIGDGWAALGAVAFHVAAEKPVIWVSGTASRWVAPMPGLDASEAMGAGCAWVALADAFGIEAGELQAGSFTREFRNKSFREAAWTLAPTPEERISVREELLDESERVLAPVIEARFTHLSLAEVEERIRQKMMESPIVRRIEGAPVTEMVATDERISAVKLANGETLECEQVFFADRWNVIGQIAGLPKVSFTRKRGALGVLQAELTHEKPMAAGIQEGFYGSIQKEAGEEKERHVWGYFSSDGARSFWTLCVSTDEAEDNHAIAKKLRRMKTSLDKMFSGSGWLPQAEQQADGSPTVATTFLSNLRSERVRFEESVLFSEGEVPSEPIEIQGWSGLSFLTDGYGPSSALHQVMKLLPLPVRPNTEAEKQDTTDAAPLA